VLLEEKINKIHCVSKKEWRKWSEEENTHSWRHNMASSFSTPTKNPVERLFISQTKQIKME